MLSSNTRKQGGKLQPTFRTSLNFNSWYSGSYDFGRKGSMPAADRRMSLLRYAAGWRHEWVGGPGTQRLEWVRTERRNIPIHCEGGIALKDRDLKKLLDQGLLRTSRTVGRTGCFGGGLIRQSFAELTPEGWEIVGR